MNQRSSASAPPGSSSRRPSDGFRYRPEIDGLRALAVLAVILHHFNHRLLPGGYLGVDIFFVISGYVITASIAARGHQAGLGPMLLGFYARRVQRLVPALLVCVLLTGLLVCLFDPQAGVSLRTGITALFGYANVHLSHEGRDYFSRASELNAFTHTWSLGVEEQFYLLFPLLLWCTGFVRGQPQGSLRLARLMTILGTTSLLSFLVLSAVEPREAFYQMPSRFWELAAGCLVFLHIRGRSAGPAGRAGWSWSVLILILLLAVLGLPPGAAPVATPAMVLLTALLLAAMEAEPAGRLRAGFALPWLVILGQLSYSLYLWHWPVLVLSRWTIGIQTWSVPILVGLMSLLALLSFHWVETPLRRLRSSSHRWRANGIGLLALLSGAGLLAWVDRDLQSRLFLGDSSGPPERGAWSLRSIRDTTITTDTCELSATGGAMPQSEEEVSALIATCTARPLPGATGSEAGRSHLYLFGDSHAMAFAPVLEHALRAGGHPVTLVARTGCPFPDPPFGHTDRSCSRLQRKLEDHVVENAAPGDVVVISDYLLSHLGDGRTLRDTRDDILGPERQVVHGGEEKLALFLEGLNRLASGLSERGVRVVLVGETPRHPDRDQCYPHWFNLQMRSACERTVAQELGHARELNRKLRQQLARGIGFFDPLTVLCAEGCDHQEVMGILRDIDHLSIEGAQRLGEPFLRFLTSAP